MDLILDILSSAKGNVSIKELIQLTGEKEPAIRLFLRDYMIKHPGKIIRTFGGYMLAGTVVPSRAPLPFKPYVPPKGMGERCAELYPKNHQHIGVGPTDKEIPSSFSYRGRENGLQ